MDRTATNPKDVKKATLYSLIPGGGQLYNEQKFKAIVFFGIFLLFIIEMISFGGAAFQGFVTLGTTPIEDHSLFLMIEGTLQIIITAIFLIFYVLNIRDAKAVAKQWNAGMTVNTTAKGVKDNVLENGFAYLLTLPAYLVMTFTIIFPVLVTLFMAFTNYDFYHIPPASLIDWVGFKNFFSIFFLSSYRDTFGAVFSWTVIW